MVDIVSYAINYTGAFPTVAAKNATSAGATDGTPYIKAILDEIWGRWQDLMLRAGLTPSGTTEAASAYSYSIAGAAQQERQANQNCYGAPGEFVFDMIPPLTGTYGSSSGPADRGVPTNLAWYATRRVIPLQGQGILIANYPELVNATYVGDANNAAATAFYKCTDAGGGTHSTSGTYFKLGDARGVTVRGFDVGATKDPGGAARLLGNLQQDAMQGHWHNAINNTSTYFQSGAGAGHYLNGTGGSGSQTIAGHAVIATGNNTDGTAPTTPRTSSESRMYNICCQIGIRY
jgi:hypothetical protein